MSPLDGILTALCVLLLALSIYLYDCARCRERWAHTWRRKYEETNEAAKFLAAQQAETNKYLDTAESNSVFFYKENRGLNSAMKDLRAERDSLKSELSARTEAAADGE